MLEPVQEDLLRSLVAAARTLPPTERTTFSVTSQIGKPTLDVYHPGLPDQQHDAFEGDLVVLEDMGFIRVLGRYSRTVFEFDVTPVGYRRIEAPAELTAASTRRRWGRWVAMDVRPWKTSRMSNIWRVRDAAAPEDPVRALKELKYAKGRSSTAYLRFVREIETLATALKGKHPGIIEVLDHTIPAEDDVSAPFYVMPLGSSSLHDAATHLHGQLEAVLSRCLPVADALGAAHEAGVVHRDVKPGNILLFGAAADARPVLGDFGICYLVEEEQRERLTRAEAHTVGTDEFVAPELLGGGQSERITPAADVYSLGKTIFAVVGGGDVFPREDFDDPRFDLVSRYSDSRLGHLVGLMQRMVTKDPADRPQTMTEVRALLERAVQNLEERVDYREGMYAAAAGPAERLGRLSRAVALPQSTARRDAVLAAIEEGATAAQRIAAEATQVSAPGYAVGMGLDHPHAAAAAAVAEELQAVGLPLVAVDDREGFEEWIAAATRHSLLHDGHRSASSRMVLTLGEVAAAHGAGALAWRQRRLELLRMVLDRLVVGGSSWIHHSPIGRNSTELLPWLVRSLSTSQILKRADAQLANDVGRPLSLIHGLAVLKWLEAAPDAELNEYIEGRATDYADFPIPFAPGLWELRWVPELLGIGQTGGPLEREIAQKLFDMNVADFRALVGRLTQPLQVMSGHALRRLNRVPYFSLNTDPRAWKSWCGGDITMR